MTQLDELYEYARENQIEVDYFLLSHLKSLSTVLSDGTNVIAIDTAKIRSAQEETVILSHEIGHCETHSFYSPLDDTYTRCRYEKRATRWAIQKLLPKDVLFSAINNGYRETWELAEYFDLPEYFIESAMWLYTNGNMDVPHLFPDD